MEDMETSIAFFLIFAIDAMFVATSPERSGSTFNSLLGGLVSLC